MTTKIRLGDLLVEHGVLTKDQLMSALKSQKKSGLKLGRELIAEGFLTDEILVDFLSEQLQIKKVNLNDHELNPEVARRLPELHSRRHNCLVIKEDETHFEVVMADPTNIYAYDDLARNLKKPFVISIAVLNDIKIAIDSVFRRSSEMQGLANELQQEFSNGSISEEIHEDLNAQETPVARFLQTMFEDAVTISASDVHIEPGENKLYIRLRQDGVLHVQAVADNRLGGPLVSRLKLMSGLDISEKRLPQDGRFQLNIKGHEIDIRLSTIPVHNGESAVMRILDQSRGILNLEQTGMNGSVLKQVRQLTKAPNGLFLVTGPTGSGKTTTLYGALSEINNPEVKILTVEDPIEYRLPGINQVQVNPKIGLDFSDILRSFLRQDPDIMLVGEMRDMETVEIAMKAAMTGHLVFSTLHTNDAISTVIRLIDMGAQPYLIASSLLGIVAQRLLRRNCEKCIEDYTPSEKEKELLHSIWGAQIDKLKFKTGAGCIHCHHSGYSGRIAVHELVVMDSKLVRALQNKDIEAFTSIAKKQKTYKSLRTSALGLAAKGITSVEQVLRLAVS